MLKSGAGRRRPPRGGIKAREPLQWLFRFILIIWGPPVSRGARKPEIEPKSQPESFALEEAALSEPIRALPSFSESTPRTRAGFDHLAAIVFLMKMSRLHLDGHSGVCRVYVGICSFDDLVVFDLVRGLLVQNLPKYH